MQIEILHHEDTRAGPPDEENVPLSPDDGPPLFDFFGLGQQVLAPVPEHAQPPEDIQNLQNELNI